MPCEAHPREGSSAGDLSGDGVPELLVGTPYTAGSAGPNTGAVRVFSMESDCDSDGAGPWAGDCDDQDGDLWHVPSEVRDVQLLDATTLTWIVPAAPGESNPALLYDVLSSFAGSDFASAGTCNETDTADTTAQIPTEPSAGQVLYILVRAQNGCGEGALGEWGPELYPRTARACP